LKASGHHADSCKNQSTEADDGSRIHGEGFEGIHQSVRPGEIHRPLGVGYGAAGAREDEGSQSRPHHMSGVEKAFFGEQFSQPSARLNRQSSGGFIQPGTTGDSIHFAPPLTSQVSYGAKLRLVFRSRPMNSRGTVMPLKHNGRFRSVASARISIASLQVELETLQSFLPGSIKIMAERCRADSLARSRMQSSHTAGQCDCREKPDSSRETRSTWDVRCAVSPRWVVSWL
jgi:hypothetical protein